MKTSLVLFSLLCFQLASLAQSIDFELTNPAPILQDADVGSMAMGDIDNDGDQDLIIIGRGGPILTTLYENDGSGGLTEVMGTPFPDMFSGTVTFADVDQDNDLDLFLVGKENSTLRAFLYTNDGSGGFTEVMGTPFTPAEGTDVAFGDVDGDNDPDLVLGGYDDNGDGFVELYLNNGSGGFSTATGTTFMPLIDVAFELGDLDNDQDLDLVITGSDAMNTSTALVYANNGSGSFSMVSNTGLAGSAQGDVALADTDGDNDLDVLISGRNAGGQIVTELYTNDGSASFTLVAGTPFSGTFVGESRFADFDMDGDQDALIVGSGMGGLADNSIVANIYENQGNNNFVLSDSLIGTYLSSVAIGDLDGDTDLDLVIAGTSTGQPVRGTRAYTNLLPPTGLEATPLATGVRLFPNPTDGALQIQFDQPDVRSIRVYNTLGAMVKTLSGITSDRVQVQLDLVSGLYLVEVVSPSAVTTHRVVVR